ncbi:UvrD-helicase domain-containing protein [Pseudomonas sp. HY13-MNA-CIBAN-0226]|uniref:UvrD-helicase domain-containing protein n=1 Tax=Pseudomonas sp. HY13-MNA-CIBAN-0226 TaxID=3140473 RepID=UPI003316BE3B
MNPFDRARRKAIEIRALLSGTSLSSWPTSPELLDPQKIEEVLDLVVESVPAGHFSLSGADAALLRQRYTIFVRSDCSPAEMAYLVSHELGHWFLDAEKTAVTVADLSSITTPHGDPSVVAVEGYGARERQELQANVFARELLLPRSAAKKFWNEGLGAHVLAENLKIPLEVVRLQLLDALLLPEQVISPVAPLPIMTPAQAAAATATERFINVVAGPGTGKTTTLIHRIKHLIEQGAEPSKILVLTFTNKAANELVERMEASGIRRASDVWAGTFHAFGLEFLRKHHDLFGLDADIHMADLLKQVRMMVGQLHKIPLKYFLRLQDPYDWLPEVFGHIDRLKEELVDVQTYRSKLAALPLPEADIVSQREDIAAVYEAYEATLRRQKLVDYTDLVALPTLQAQKDRASVTQYFDHFDHILVDEYQDVTHVLVEFVRELSRNAKSVWVVGDIRQAIHHWRGASIMSLMKFDSAFRKHAPNAQVRKYELDLNRRSTPEILDLFCHAGREHVLQPRLPLEHVTAYRQSVGMTPSLFECASPESQSQTLGDAIVTLANRGVEYRDQVVISRSKADIEQVADALSARRIPHLYIGDVSQRPEVKRLVCLMQLLCTRQPRSLVGLIQEPKYAMSVADMELLTKTCSTKVMLQRGKWLKAYMPGLSINGQAAQLKLSALLSGFSRHSRPWDFVCSVLLDRRFGLPDPSNQSMEAHTERLALWLFAYAVRNGDGDAKEARLSRFLLREELRRRINEKLADRGIPPEARALNAVPLMTVHGSKGLEFQAVHLIGVDKDAFGSEKSWKYDARASQLVPPEVLNSTQSEHDFEASVERNNLLYVALSRAKDELYLYEPSRRDRPAALGNSGRLLNKFPGSAVPMAAIKPTPFAGNANVGSINYSHFESFINCPLHYHYRYELSLTAEQQVDISIRARWAVMDTLEGWLKGIPAKQAFADAWGAHKLPSAEEDPGLHRDAVIAANRGAKIIQRTGGSLITDLMADVQGVRIELPWMILVDKPGATEIHWLRTQAGVDTTLSHMRPMMLNIAGRVFSKVVVHSLLTEKSKENAPAYAPETTSVYKMAKRFVAGDRSAKKGFLCRRCAYLSICENRP